MKLKTFLILFLCCFVLLHNANGQVKKHIQWSTSINQTSSNEYELIFTAKLDSGWNIYGLFEYKDGAFPLFYEVLDTTHIESYGEVSSREEAFTRYDKVFKQDINSYKDEVNFILKVKADNSNKDATVLFAFEYMIYDHEQVIPLDCLIIKYHIDRDGIRNIKVGKSISECDF